MKLTIFTEDIYVTGTSDEDLLYWEEYKQELLLNLEHQASDLFRIYLDCSYNTGRKS